MTDPCKMRLTALDSDILHWAFIFNFRSLDLSLFNFKHDSEGYFMLCYGEEFEVEWNRLSAL